MNPQISPPMSITLNFSYKITTRQSNMKQSSRQSQNHNHINIRTTPDQTHKPPSLSGCPNHPEKPVTHSLISSESQQMLNYCQKCSIMLASQGFNVIKIKRNLSAARRSPLSHQTPKNPRRSQVQQFLSQLNHQVQTVKSYGFQSEAVLRESEEHYSAILTQITSYYEQMKNILQIQKYLTYNQVLVHRTAAENDLRMLREQLIAEMEKLVGIGHDIQSNMEAAETVEQDVYETIMNNYRGKLNMSYQIQELDIMQIQKPNFTIPEIPTIMHSLANKFFMQPQPDISLSANLYTKREMSLKSCKQSAQSSRIKPKTEEVPKVCKMMPTLLCLQSTESIQDKDQAYSFDNNSDYVRSDESRLMRRALFNDCRRNYHPVEIPFRQSLNLTQIRQNQQEQCLIRQQFSCLEQTIPEQMLTSRQSIEGYLAPETLGHSQKASMQREQTDTLLIS